MKRRILALLAALALGACASPSRESETAAVEDVPHGYGVPCCPQDTVIAGLGETTTTHRVTRTVMTVSERGNRTACGYRLVDEEAYGATILCGDDEPVAVIRGAIPVAWDPAGGRLLMRESAADDDLRHFVLDVGHGEIEKHGDRLGWVLGERADRFVRWHGDTLWFRNQLDPAQDPHAVLIPIRPSER